MYLTPKNNFWTCDIETDSLDATVIWVACAVNVLTKEELTFTDPEEFREWAKGKVLIFHNGIAFDAPTLNRLWQTDIKITDQIDTFVMSMMYSPALDGGHSLGAWGRRLRAYKGEFSDWSHLSPEMIEYCLQDCRVTRLIYLTLCQRMAPLFSELSCDIETRAWQLLKEQQKTGFAFDLPRAHQFYAFLRNRQEDIKNEILKYWPPRLEAVKRYLRPFKKDGTPSAAYARHQSEFERVELVDGGRAYDCYAYVSFNIGSPPQRTEKLLALGWEPREFTETGLPKATHKGRLTPSLEEFVAFSGKKEVRLIASWIEVSARANLVGNWIDNCGPDSRIHGSLWLNNTLRYRHSNPNSANIPAVRVGKDDKPLFGDEGAWTYEARDLWVAGGEDRVLIGVDAKGIQLRSLAHYLNNPVFTDNVLSKDPHAANQQAFGLPSRALSKTIVYAILMGAGDAKVADTAGITLKEAKRLKKIFFEQVPELPQLIKRLKAEANSTGRIKLVDGSSVIMKQDYMVIPYLLQGDESKIMKVAMLRIRRDCRRLGIDAKQVGMVHDELQTDVLATDAEAYVKIALDAFNYAGKFFKYNIQVDGDAKIGKTWSQTH